MTVRKIAYTDGTDVEDGDYVIVKDYVLQLSTWISNSGKVEYTDQGCMFNGTRQLYLYDFIEPLRSSKIND